MNASAALEIRGLTKSFAHSAALNDVSLDVGSHELMVLLGPSGAGKTTLLRVLAGLETPEAGAVRFDGEDFLAIPARRRRAGMVFQHYALFRHMTVAENIAFGPEVRPRAERAAPSEIRGRVDELLALVQLEGLGGRYPAQLSGGQRQRVALARALAIEPRLLLLDEPFGALDAPVRQGLRRWLRELHARAGTTTLFVTHDQEEALDLADRIAVLKDGRMVQAGDPQLLYERPASAFVFEFLGPACRLPGVCKRGRLTIGAWTLQPPPHAPTGEVDVFFRPDEVDLRPEGQGLLAQVRTVSRRGPETRVACEVLGHALDIRLRAQLVEGLVPGATLYLLPARPAVFPRDP